MSPSTTHDEVCDSTHDPLNSPNKYRFTIYWRPKLGLPDPQVDCVKWNAGWEKAISSFTSARRVIEEMQQAIFGADDYSCTVPAALPADLTQMLAQMSKIIRERQLKAVKIVGEILPLDHLDTIWLLLDVTEQRRHILQSLVGACTLSLTGEDARAVCPELTLRRLLAQRGKGLVEFVSQYHKVSRMAEPDKLFFLPNAWWDEAVSDAAPPLLPKAKVMYELATLYRADFAAAFVLTIMGSIMGDIAKRSEGMQPVLDFVENSDGFFSRFAGRVKASMRDKPLVRCENCTKTPEDIGPNVRFMVCSACKAELKFTVHYCSRQCQREDWKTHRRNCGKKPVSKGLPGTAGDLFWMYDNPNAADFVRDVMRERRGNADFRLIGIGPAQYVRPAALQLQVDMLEKDKDAEYFLFNDTGEPVRFVIDDMWTKLHFRIIRRTAVSNLDKEGYLALGEYLIKMMSSSPGLSRQRILDQLSAEYGQDTL